jgi:hypothetical protein
MTRVLSIFSALMLFSGITAAQTPTVSIEPESQTVGVGQEVRVHVHVDGFPAIRTYGIRISYDRTLLRCAGVEKAGYFGGYNTFYFNKVDSVRGLAGADESILGPGHTTGEGDVFTLRFLAIARGSAELGFAALTVYDSLVQVVQPIDSKPGTVVIDVQNAIDPLAAPAALALDAPWPNPVTAGTDVHLSFSGGMENARVVSIHDNTGRLIREFKSADAESEHGVLRWDGRSASGQTVPPGIYHIRLRSVRECVTRSIIVLSR